MIAATEVGHCQPRAGPLLGFEDSAPTYAAELLAYCRRHIYAGLDSHLQGGELNMNAQRDNLFDYACHEGKGCGNI